MTETQLAIEAPKPKLFLELDDQVPSAHDEKERARAPSDAEVANDVESQNGANKQQKAEFSFDLRVSCLNPLLEASASLIALALRLSSLTECKNLSYLHQRAIHEIESIELELYRRGYDQTTVLAYRYCFCTFLDEMVMATPWGKESVWSQESLLSTFHQETWGGEKFFTIIDRLCMEPEKYLHLLEFLYTCLCLGYEGEHKIAENGRPKLEAYIKELHTIIRNAKGEPQPLSFWNNPEKVVDKPHAMTWRTPITAVYATAFAAAIVLYCGFFFYTDRYTDDALSNLKEILSTSQMGRR